MSRYHLLSQYESDEDETNDEEIEVEPETVTETAISVTDKMIERYYKRNFKSFDTFKDAQTSIWVVEMPMDSNKWKEATCTCPVNLKTFICKHVVGIACRLKFCKIPPNAKDVAVGEKRKRGRVPKATKALLKD